MLTRKQYQYRDSRDGRVLLTVRVRSGGRVDLLPPVPLNMIIASDRTELECLADRLRREHFRHRSHEEVYQRLRLLIRPAS